MTPVEALEQTADLLEQGWCQWNLRWPSEGNAEQYCVRGALRQVIMGNARRIPEVSGRLLPLYSVLRGAICREVGVRSNEEQLTCWNDAKGRTKEEVVAVVRNAKRFVQDDV